MNYFHLFLKPHQDLVVTEYILKIALWNTSITLPFLSFIKKNLQIQFEILQKSIWTEILSHTHVYKNKPANKHLVKKIYPELPTRVPLIDILREKKRYTTEFLLLSHSDMAGISIQMQDTYNVCLFLTL